MSADRPFFAGDRGHFCAGCEFPKIRHLGCRTDGSLQLDPTDPNLLEMKAQAREARQNTQIIAPIVESEPLKIT